jgi:3,4-dihydroxy 2-butanone 4-phosphate synthase / GTP cyclohydrolase II
LTRKRCEELRLPLMAAHNQSRHSTAFTLSIEAREGVTTGISAADRAHTVAVAIAPSSTREDLATPGHVFPLMAKDGAMAIPAGVICEIMNDDGSMARLPDLVKFAQLHGLKIATIADLIEYRRRTERLVKVTAEAPFSSRYGGDWKMRVYTDSVSGAEHVVLVKGKIDGTRPTLVRMHQINLLADIFWDTHSTRTGELQKAMELIDAEGSGVVVVIRDPVMQPPLSERIAARARGEEITSRLLDYGVGAQMLVDVGVRKMILLTNTSKTVIALDGYGLEIVDQRPIPLS